MCWDRTWIIACCYLLSVTGVSAKCSGEGYAVRLGQTFNIHKMSDGGPCTSKVNGSKDPIYGSLIVARPKHGSLTSVGRTVLVYRPQPGFKGEDSYSFQWVGKREGVTPDAVTVNVAVTVQ